MQVAIIKHAETIRKTFKIYFGSNLWKQFFFSSIFQQHSNLLAFSIYITAGPCLLLLSLEQLVPCCSLWSTQISAANCLLTPSDNGLKPPTHCRSGSHHPIPRAHGAKSHITQGTHSVSGELCYRKGIFSSPCSTISVCVSPVRLNETGTHKSLR